MGVLPRKNMKHTHDVVYRIQPGYGKSIVNGVCLAVAPPIIDVPITV